MYPTNQYMDPYYYHYRNHSPYSYYPPPGWEAGHPRGMDSYYRPPNYGPWPYNAGMSHPHPSEFHCCCNHSYPTGYYGFRPPFPQELPPPHLYYHGPFPQHPQEYPSHFGRPHPYPVEQTPSDYKNFNSHCCGCPNHVCHDGEKSSVKIEEERPHGKPVTELKDADNSSLIRYPNNQYPVIWLPSGNMEDKEKENAKIPPHLLNGRVPVGGKWAEDANQQGKDDPKDKRFQWPIAWMPAGYDQLKQKAKDVNGKDEKPKITEETPSSPKIKIIPLSWFEDPKPAAKSASRDHSDRSAVETQPATTEHRDGAAVEGHHKTTPAVPRSITAERKPARENYKTIPVLPAKETDNKVATCRTIPVMTQKENDEKKPVVSEKEEEKKAACARKQGENGKGNQIESTTAKHSKLPPVCLRVDPLPRKKQGNGSSRSPSPPRKDADKAKKDMNVAQSQNLEPKQSDTQKHVTVPEMKETSSEELKNGKGFSNETVQASSVKRSQEEVPASNDHQKVQTSSSSVHAQENADAGARSEGVSAQENAGAETLKGGDKSRDSEAFRANLSEADAAVRIQSAYRGYDVRRWQPLDKLRKIRDVHEQMQSAREQLQRLETSSKKPTEKEQVAIGEAIMNLLLKLDTIQGLHPCVRESRKSATRELISLQEKLDSLCKQTSGGFHHTNENERLDESVVHATAPTLTVEASDKEEKSVGLREAEEISPVNSTELCHAVPSEANLEMGKDTDTSEVKNEEEKSCTSTVDVPFEREKAAEEVEFQGGPSADIMSAAALPEHPHDNNEHQIGESDTGSLEASKEEKKIAAVDEGLEVPLLDSMESDATPPAVGSCEEEKCMASIEHSPHSEEPNTGVSPPVTGDIKATMGIESLGNGAAADNNGSAEDQTEEAVRVQRSESKEDVPPAEESLDVPVSLKDTEPHEHHPTAVADSVASYVDEQSEEVRSTDVQEQVADSTQDSTREPDGTLEPSMGPTLEGPADSVASNVDEQSEEARSTDVQEQVADSTQDSTREPDGILDASMGPALEEPADSVASHVNEQSEEARSTDVQEQVADSTQDSTREPDGTLEASMGPTLEEPADSVACHVDEQSEEARSTDVQERVADSTQDSTRESDGTLEASIGPTLEEPAASEEPPQAASTSEVDSVSEQTVLEESNNAMQSELPGKDDFPHVDQNNEVLELTGGLNVQESNHSIAEGAYPRTKTELDSSESAAEYERTDTMVPLKIQSTEQNEDAHSLSADAQASNTEEPSETLEAPAMVGANSVEKVEARASETDKCNGIRATGVTSAEVEADNLNEDVGVQIESKASEESLPASVTPDGVKDSDEKKLVEENQKLRALLQKLLASGNDQMDIITDLSEKVKVLERKLARKKKPKVRVHRPTRHATARVH